MGKKRVLMNLTIHILRIELSERLKCKVFWIDNGCGSIESPKFYEPGITALPGQCYVSESIQPQEWNHDNRTLFIVCGEVLEESFKDCTYSALYFSKSQSILHVMNVLLEIFAKYHHWDESLLKLQNESSSLDALLQLSLPIFKNPLFLIDSAFNVLAIAVPGLPPDFEHPDKVEDIWIIRGKEDLIKTRDVHEPYYHHLPNDYPRLFINLLDGEHFLGNLSIQASHHEFREYDEYLLTHLAGILRSAILRFGSADSKTRNLIENMLSGIIDGRIINEEEFTRVLTFVGVAATEQFQCLAIKVPKPSGNEYIRYFLQQLETKIPAIYIPTYGEVAAMVLRVSIAEQQEINVISTLQKELESFGVRVGLSDTYDDLLCTKQYFTQARFALEAGEVTQNENSILHFTDYCMDYILENCPGNLKASMLFTEGFKRLVKHDIDGRVSYIETLRAYLDNNLNANKAATTLYITRNSFLSRLERINTLLDEDIHDPRVRFRLELSLLLYDKWNEM